MGSYRMNCCVSGVSIGYQDPIRWFPLIKNEQGGALLYDRYFPGAFPLRATCGSTGEANDIEEGEGRQLWYEAFGLTALDEFMTSSKEEQRVVITDEAFPAVHLYEVQCGMIHEEAWQKLVTSGVRVEGPLGKECSVQDYRDAARFAYGPNVDRKSLYAVSFARHAIARVVCGGAGVLEMGSLVKPLPNLGLAHRLIMEREPLSDAFLDAVAEFLFINYLMEESERQWLPSSYGYQLPRWSARRAVLEASLQVMEAQERKDLENAEQDF